MDLLLAAATFDCLALLKAFAVIKMLQGLAVVMLCWALLMLVRPSAVAPAS